MHSRSLSVKQMLMIVVATMLAIISGCSGDHTVSGQTGGSGGDAESGGTSMISTGGMGGNIGGQNTGATTASGGVGGIGGVTTTMTNTGASGGTGGGTGGQQVIVPNDSHCVWFTDARLDDLKSAAAANDPLWPAFEELADGALADVVSGIYPGADPGACGGILPVSNEERAIVLALASKITNDPGKAQQYLTAGHTLWAYVNEHEALGTDGSGNYKCATGDRSQYWGAFQAVAGACMADSLTPDDVNTFVVASTLKANALNAVDPPYAPYPKGVVNDPSLLTPWGVNNYWNSYALLMVYRSLASQVMAAEMGEDPDPDLQTNLDDVLGSWLYVTDQDTRNICVPGYWSEGTEYAASGFGGYVQTQLGLLVAGQNDPALHGQQVDPTSNPFFTNFMRGYLFSRGRAKGLVPDFEWEGNKPLISTQGDLQRYPDVDSHLKFLGPLYELALGMNDTKTANAVRWTVWSDFNEDLGNIADFIKSGLDSGNSRNAIFLYAMFAGMQAEPTDPRLIYPTVFMEESAQRGAFEAVTVSDWSDPKADMATIHCGWRELDHQAGSCGSVELMVNGVWLTKRWDGYGAVATGASFGNTAAIENDQPFSLFGSAYDDWKQGNQWEYDSRGDAVVVNKAANDTYVTATFDMTDLYNLTPNFGAQDVERATRSIFVNRGKNTMVILDRQTTGAPERFKRVWFNTAVQASITGTRATAAGAPGDPTLTISVLHPLNATITNDNTKPFYTGDNPYDQTAAGNLMNSRVKIEALNDPQDVVFVTVQQGTKAQQTIETTTLIESADGSFKGARFNNWAVLSPTDIYTVTMPLTTTLSGNGTLFVTGLSPNTDYGVTIDQNGASSTIVVDGDSANGDAMTTDPGGVLVVTF